MYKILLITLLWAGLLHAEIQPTMTDAMLTAELYGSEGNKEKEIDGILKKLDTVGYSTVSENKNIHTHYYNKFGEKNVEMISFFSVLNKEKLRPLLLSNPDFGAYAPFNFLVYKTLDTKQDNNTWYGHLKTDTMLDIMAIKDEKNRKEFTDMVGSLDTLIEAEMKPKLKKKFEHVKPLPEHGLKKFIMKFERTDDLEDFVDEFISDYDGRFAKREFIIAGFVDIKFEYDDLELEFDKYDAYWVSQLCHFEFSNSIFNRGMPEAGMFAPCSIYFYIPKGTNELHVGYASVDNWINALNFTNQKRIDYMKSIDAQILELLANMGLTEVKQKASAAVTKPSVANKVNKKPNIEKKIIEKPNIASAVTLKPSTSANSTTSSISIELETLKKKLEKINAELQTIINSI